MAKPVDKEKLALTDEEKVQAQKDYIKRTYQEDKVVLNFPLQGWRREECLLKAQLAKATSLIREQCFEEWIPAQIKAEKLIREEVMKEVEKQIWKSSYILPTNKPKVLNGIKQALIPTEEEIREQFVEGITRHMR